MEIKAQYKHTKYGNFMFGLCKRRTPFFIDYLTELGIAYDEAYKEENIKKLNQMRSRHFRKNSK